MIGKILCFIISLECSDRNDLGLFLSTKIFFKLEKEEDLTYQKKNYIKLRLIIGKVVNDVEVLDK
jgi:hypothetical protein